MHKPIRGAVRNGTAGGAPRIPVPKTTAVVPGTIKADREERHRRISEAAYYRSQRRAFEPGREEEDWLEAEKELYSAEERGGSREPDDNGFRAPK